MDPLTIAAIAAGAQAVGGGLQALFSGRKKAEGELNSFAKQSPLAQASKSLNDYYQESKNRYYQNPYQSAFYTAGQKNIQRSTASALNALQGYGAAIAGAGRAALGQDTAMTNLGVQAEGQKRADFGQYGQAAQMQQNDANRVFQINQMDPYLRQFGLKQYAAQAANARQNAGLQTMASGIGNVAQVYAYGGGKKDNTKNDVPVFPSNPVGFNPYGNYGNFSNTNNNPLFSKDYSKYGVGNYKQPQFKSIFGETYP